MARGIVIGLKLDENLSQALDRAEAEAGDLTPAMKEIAVHLEGVTRLRFENERGPGGTPWKPSERVRLHGGQTLFLHGDLKSSITSDYGPAFAEVGSEKSFGSAIYAAIHQFGGIIRPRAKKALSFGGRIFAQVVMPARPFLGFDDQDRENITDILRRFVARLLGGGSAAGGPS